jgi:hypothetical protein
MTHHVYHASCIFFWFWYCPCCGRTSGGEKYSVLYVIFQWSCCSRDSSLHVSLLEALRTSAVRYNPIRSTETFKMYASLVPSGGSRVVTFSVCNSDQYTSVSVPIIHFNAYWCSPPDIHSSIGIVYLSPSGQDFMGTILSNVQRPSTSAYQTPFVERRTESHQGYALLCRNVYLCTWSSIFRS